MNVKFLKLSEKFKSEYFEMSKDFYSSGVTNSVISDEGREKFFKEILLGEIVRGYLITCDDNIAGYAICALCASAEASGRILQLDELYIKPSFRGKGIGRAFFGYIENSDEYAYIRLEVEKDNEKALSLYTSLGYKDIGYFSLYKKTNKLKG